jgi:hypothetical protein
MALGESWWCWRIPCCDGRYGNIPRGKRGIGADPLRGDQSLMLRKLNRMVLYSWWSIRWLACTEWWWLGAARWAIRTLCSGRKGA